MLILLVLFGTYVASVVYIRQRGRTFPKLTRQMSDFSTFLVPFNAPAYLLSKVPTQPFIDKKHFPELKLLDDNWETIRDEAMALYKLGYIDVRSDLPASSFYKDNRWKSFYLKVYGNEIPSAREHAPKTMALIDKVPSMNIALFAMLMPGKTINQHHDPFSYTMRYSLGLSTPNSDDCGITVDYQDYKWKDGESIIFDENFMHDAYNHTDTPRLILMTDVDRPLKWPWVQKIYYYFGYWFNRAFGIDNLDDQHTGIGNKLGSWLVGYKAFMKNLKHSYPTAYKIGKIVLYGGLVLLLIDALL